MNMWCSDMDDEDCERLWCRAIFILICNDTIIY